MMMISVAPNFPMVIVIQITKVRFKAEDKSELLRRRFFRADV
jgi:hypothetical protein